MTTVQVPLPDDVFSAVRRSPEEISREMRLAIAALWYAEGVVSQERGAEIAGLGRAEFMQALGRVGISPFQETVDDIRETLRNA